MLVFKWSPDAVGLSGFRNHLISSSRGANNKESRNSSNIVWCITVGSATSWPGLVYRVDLDVHVPRDNIRPTTNALQEPARAWVSPQISRWDPEHPFQWAPHLCPFLTFFPSTIFNPNSIELLIGSGEALVYYIHLWRHHFESERWDNFASGASKKIDRHHTECVCSQIIESLMGVHTRSI